MDTKDLRKLKRKLQSQVFTLIHDFEKLTDLEVDGISLTRSYCVDQTSELVQVSIKICVGGGG